MLQKFDLKGVHTTIDESLQKYVTKKIGHLDKYMPKAHRDSVHAVVELKEVPKAQDQNRFSCFVTMYMPQGDTLVVQESTLNMYAAIDIVEEKLRILIKKYKETHAGGGKLARHLAGRLSGRVATPPVIEE